MRCVWHEKIALERACAHAVPCFPIHSTPVFKETVATHKWLPFSGCTFASSVARAHNNTTSSYASLIMSSACVNVNFSSQRSPVVHNGIEVKRREIYGWFDNRMRTQNRQAWDEKAKRALIDFAWLIDNWPFMWWWNGRWERRWRRRRRAEGWCIQTIFFSIRNINPIGSDRKLSVALQPQGAFPTFVVTQWKSFRWDVERGKAIKKASDSGSWTAS